MTSARQDRDGAGTVRGDDRRRARSDPIGPRIGRTVLAALCVLWVDGTSARAAEEKLDLGMVSDSPSKTIKRFTPLHDYLAGKGLPMGKIVNAQSISSLVSLIKEGKVDLVFESPNGAVQIMEATGAVPVLIREKDGIREYNSVIFVNDGSPIQRLEDLVGKVITFEDPESTSSYVLPRRLLTNAGLQVVESAEPVPGKVAYYFSRGDDNVLAHVKLGRADAGGMDRGAVAKHPQFRALAPESGYVPRHVLLARDGVDYGQLKEALLRMAADPSASGVLEAAETPTGFSAFNGDPGEVMDEVKASLGL